MAWTIELTPQAKKDLGSIDKSQARRIRDFLNDRVACMEDPRQSSRKLKNSKFGEVWRIRIGDYRIIYTIEDDKLILLVVRIGHRRSIYR